MNIEILNTGSELLLGDVTNTHLPVLAKRLFPLGLRVSRQTTVPDGAPIREEMAAAFARCDVLLVTGGLGPTTDDVTRELCAELLGLPLVEDPGISSEIEARLALRGFAYLERMRRQAMVPRGAHILPNANGTAPGLYIPRQWRLSSASPHVFLLPGPPREMLPMFDDHVMPKIRELAGDLPLRERRVFHVVGMGESRVEEVIGLALTLRGDIEVGYCARPNEVDLRLIASKEILDAVEPGVLAALGSHLVSKRGENIEESIVATLRERQLTLSCAESCTGGLLSHRITNVPGSSDVFSFGAVTYANAAKSDVLGVSAELISVEGAVSAAVAEAMAMGVRERTGSDFALSVTGIAGPGGGSESQPVGTVFIGLATKNSVSSLKAFFPVDRETFKQLATQKALDLLRQNLAQ